MPPDQGPFGSSTCFSTTAAYAIAIMHEPKPQEEHFEPFVPTTWKLESKRYDRINAKRKYLSEVARAKRHFGIKKPIRKPNRRKHKVKTND